MTPVMFLHIPKTAGTSLRLMLASQYAQHEIMPVPLDWGTYTGEKYPVNNTRYAGLTMQDADDYKLVMGHYDWSHVEQLSPRWRVFTFFRSPEERFLSEFFFARDRATDHPHHQATQMSLADFVYTDTARLYFANQQVRYMSGKTSGPLAQRDYYKALAAVNRLDCIGIVDDFDRSVELLEASYGYHFAEHLKVNPTPRPEQPDTATWHQIVQLCSMEYLIYSRGLVRYNNMRKDRLND